MKVSVNWLGEYFKEKLPSADKLAHLFTFHAFEVEGVEKIGEDHVLDLKVLPDRAHYALSHRGIALEVAVIAGLSEKEKQVKKIESKENKNLTINIKDSGLCRRYIGRRISGIKVKDSPDFLKNKLETIGQRSINSIIDATNFVMFDIGQPLHAFDADKVKGAITVRLANEGEKLELLPEKVVIANGAISEKERNLTLKGGELIIADEEGPLALAGIKGGMRAVVTEKTENLILESANFDPVNIRKTSTFYNIRNDSSKRFENEISPELAMDAMLEISALIESMNPDAKFSEIIDEYPNQAEKWSITVTSEYVSKLLGIEVKAKRIEEILLKMKCNVSQRDNALVVEPPYWRLDLKIPQDIAEEVGRIIGYENITVAQLPKLDSKHKENKVFYWSEKIKDVLVGNGFSEIYSYVLTDKGYSEIINPLASDKNFVRANLSVGLKNALEFNQRNADLLGLDQVLIFEIGKIFTKEGEKLSLCFGVANIKGKSKTKEAETLSNVMGNLKQLLGTDIEKIGKNENNVFELVLDEIIENMPEINSFDLAIPEGKNNIFKSISDYPFAVRDIAVFVPKQEDKTELETIINEEAGQLLARLDLFDVFEKTLPDGSKKTSLAYRIVFQSYERTLGEQELNDVMKRITDRANSNPNWQVR